MQPAWQVARRVRLGLAVMLLAALLPAAGAAAGPQEVNAAPVANNDSMVAFINEGYQDFYVLDNDTDADVGDTLTVLSVSPAQHGSAGCCVDAPSYRYIFYKPFAGYSGPDSFTYTVRDNGGLTDTATVNVTVAASGQVSSGRVAIHGAPDDRLTLVITPKAGGPTSATAGSCNGTSLGIAVEDAVIEPGNSTYYEAFDNGLTFFIDGEQLTPHFPLSVSHRNLASGPQSVNGLNIGLAYYGVSTSYTLRTLLSVSNPTGVTKNVSVTVASNLGLSGQFVYQTSSGDENFDTGDRWVVTTSHETNPFVIVDTHVIYGPGAPVTPSTAGDNVFTCEGSEGIRARFLFSVLAGQTRRLLFFNQFHKGNAVAVTEAAVFNVTPVGMLEGLSNNQLSQVVNWALPSISRQYLPDVQDP